MKSGDFAFSYSGLKTAVLNYTAEIGPEMTKKHLSHICASFQKAAIEVLVKKTIEAARAYQARTIVLAGGVAANSLLRSWMQEAAAEFNLSVSFPPMAFCTDNAAMIARAGLAYLNQNITSDMSLNVFPSLRLPTDGRDG
jgi:N6-L-threonylcarbamoyladenine synthase